MQDHGDIVKELKIVLNPLSADEISAFKKTKSKHKKKKKKKSGSEQQALAGTSEPSSHTATSVTSDIPGTDDDDETMDTTSSQIGIIFIT